MTTQLARIKNMGLPSLFDVFDDLFDRNLFEYDHYSVGPRFREKNYDDRYEVSVAIPGVKKDEIKIESNNHKLMISSENKSEFGYSSFSKTWHLPDGADFDKIKAKYENGILSVIIPKCPEMKNKIVQIE